MPYDVEKLDRSAVGSIEVNPGTGFVHLGSIVDEVLKVNGKEITHMGVMSYPFGVDKRILGPVDVAIDFTWEQIADNELWAMVLHGGAITMSTAGTTSVTDEVVILTGTDWIPLVHAANFDDDCTVVVSDAAGGGTPHTINTDYYLSRETGSIARVAGGGIADGEVVYVDYVYNTFVGKYFDIYADTVPTEYTFRLIKPLLNLDNLRIQHTKATFAAAAELSLTPGEEGAWSGVKSTLNFVKDVGGTYGTFGRWEIYTP